MGNLRQLNDRVSITFDVESLLGAPVILWDKATKKWDRTTHNVAEVFINLMWMRFAHAHPELAKAGDFSDMQLTYKDGKVTVDFMKVPTSEVPKS